jgi:hypothetical protein
MATFEDHRAYTDPPRARILDEIRRRTFELDERVRSGEGVTAAQRIGYEVPGRHQIFMEVKVRRAWIDLRLLGRDHADPAAITTLIPRSYKWTFGKNIRISTLADLEAAMPSIEASYHRST